MSRGTLIVECKEFDIDCAMINWDILRTIEIRSSISYKQMLAIILHLSNLDFLHVRRLAFSDNEIEMLNRDMRLLTAQPVEPLISDIRILIIGTATDLYSADMIMAKVMYLVLGLINLKELHIDEDLQLHAIQFIKLCRDSYPHLANIQVQ
ncbi:hypothetical protein H4R20_002308 [Coemansia guatemalensis]|uniref:Uncharacterized protein n=1 Tax=Coemansia guatemalensis TaxID=2761395 RepID=A0A9W8I2R0_9FUNG|nr:hypothetical protein H4R20_002308 [Coemansia guatemalensis]